MPSNADIARIFFEMASVMELTGANVYKTNAYANAARVINDHTANFAELACDKKSLLKIPGIGEGAASKIIEFCETGVVAEHQRLIATVPPGLIAITRIPGVGPKTARMLWEKAGVTDLESLRAKLESGALAGIPRLGEKTIENIRNSLVFATKAIERTRLGAAMELAENLIEFLRPSPGAGVQRLEYAGSLRRGCETIGDIDLLAVCDSPATLAAAFTNMPLVSEVLGEGEAKCSVRLNRGMQVDLRLIDAPAFGAAMLYFTGSKQHNVLLRERAIKMKLRLNEYGLFPYDRTLEQLENEQQPGKKPIAPQKRGVKPLAADTEQAIYAALNLPWIPPELREGRSELALTTTPALIQLDDIKAELHAHTTASDGTLTIEQLAAEAKSRGFHTIAVTDHSQSSFQARGLKPEALRIHIANVREAARRIKDIRVLAGAEVDILPDGRLDYDDDLLAELDIVVASPHAGLKQSPEDATRRLLRAIANPYVRILGHPTGRLVNRREGISPDIEALVKAAVKHNVALEINANHHRLDLRDTHVKAAIDGGALIAIDTDAHTYDDFDELRYGVMTARRGWVTPERCINAWPQAKLQTWLKSKR